MGGGHRDGLLRLQKTLLADGWKLVLTDPAQGPLDAAILAELRVTSEIVYAAVFLLDGSKASSMTGHFLNADGG